MTLGIADTPVGTQLKAMTTSPQEYTISHTLAGRVMVLGAFISAKVGCRQVQSCAGRIFVTAAAVRS